MSLHHLAKHVQSAGRNDDSMLVHMTPREVAGLQKLAMSHGGSLTVNPHTGLPEAGFLSSILPAIAGAALMATGVGAPLAAGIVGLGDYAITGSVKQGIMAGLGAYGGADLASGLSNAGEMSLANAGGEAAATDYAAQLQNIPNQAMDASRGMVEEATPLSTAQEQIGQMKNLTPDQINNFNSSLTEANAADTVKNAGFANSSLDPNVSYFDKLKAGTSAASAEPMKYLGQNWKQLAMVSAPVMAELNKPKPAPGVEPYNGPLSKYHLASDFQGYTPPQPNPYYKAQGLGYADGGLAAIRPNLDFANTQTPAGLLASTTGYDTQVHPMTGQEIPFSGGGSTSKANITQQRPDFVDQATLDAMPAWERAKYQLGNDMYFSRGPGAVANTPSAMESLGRVTIGKAGGGIIGQLMDQIDANNYPKLSANFQTMDIPALTRHFGDGSAPAAAAPTNIGTTAPTQHYHAQGLGYAAGGISSLGSYSDGGRMLKGPGDGMSDSIPASISNKQPARLADGEFVVPADVVSHLGNGSTDAGAKQLYKMMDKVRQARTGNKKQGKQIKPEKYLP